LNDWECFTTIDYSPYFISLTETWNNDYHPTKFESYDVVLEGIKVDDEISM